MGYTDTETFKSASRTYYSDYYPYSESTPSATAELWDANKYGAGKLWRDNGKVESHFRGVNKYLNDAYGCPRFDVGSNGELLYIGEYPSGALRYEKTCSEDGDSIILFYDTENHLVAERKYCDRLELDTHHVYNSIGQLTYVISPKATKMFYDSGATVCDTAVVRKLCWHYAYDSYNRLVEKRAPGAEPEYYVYDQLDNIVLKQDGNLRKSGKWRVTKLDSKLRKAVEGLTTFTGATRASLQEQWKNRLAIESRSSSIINLLYTDTCGIAGFEPLVSYFYDDYTHWTAIIGSSLPTDSSYPAGLQNASGLATGKALIDESGIYIVKAVTYDDKNRILLECEGDYDQLYRLATFYKYSFVGDLTGKKTAYDNNDIGLSYTSEYAYTYDMWGVRQATRHRLNSGTWTTLCTYNYDEVMRLKSKTIYPRKASSGNTIKFTNNIRGWITSINSPAFKQGLHYGDSIQGYPPRWGGSPSAMSFTSVNSSGGLDSCMLAYRYDFADRLTSVTQTTTLDSNKAFSESFAYDENGNPEIITRGNTASAPVQYISVSYDGNRICSLNESKTADGLYPSIPSIAKGDYESGWSYDGNGNRTADPARSITSITYNSYNQPLQFTFSDGSRLTERYLSDGTYSGRLEREAVISTVSGSTATTTSYTVTSISRKGDFLLKNSIPVRLYIEGGYIDLPNGDVSNAAYNYYIHDYQGSVRAVINEQGGLVQATDYSAYGVPSSRYNAMTADNRLHLELEWQPMKGLNGYYNNARFRDALLAGSFYQHDPLAEKYYQFSPYNYSANNPVLKIDHNGKAVDVIWDISNIVLGAKSCADNIAAGNYLDAAVDGVGVAVDALAAAIPVVPGGVGTAIKFARVANKSADVLIEMHHLIPKKLKKLSIVKEAIKQGFKFDGPKNTISLNKFIKSNEKGVHANHPKYSDAVEERLTDSEFIKNRTPLEVANDITDRLRKDIVENPETKINDLYKPGHENINHQNHLYKK